MRKQIAAIALCMLVLASVAIAADDPFTGTWRSKIEERLKIEHVEGGISMQTNQEKPLVVIYGKDTPYSDGGDSVNFVRLDDHTLFNTARISGVDWKVTLTVSADGKNCKQVREAVGTPGRSFTIEYVRIGPVPSGDAFFGTWRVNNTGETYILEVDGNSFDFTRNGRHVVTAGFDGKEYANDLNRAAFRLRRIDSQTIELLIKRFPRQIPENIAATLSPEMRSSVTSGSEDREVWQVKGNALTVTSRSLKDPQAQPVVTVFKRVK